LEKFRSCLGLPTKKGGISQRCGKFITTKMSSTIYIESNGRAYGTSIDVLGIQNPTPALPNPRIIENLATEAADRQFSDNTRPGSDAIAHAVAVTKDITLWSTTWRSYYERNQ